jgi:hypothetical protein
MRSTLQPGEDLIIGRRLRELLAGAHKGAMHETAAR